jgi:hypothetical protein
MMICHAEPVQVPSAIPSGTAGSGDNVVSVAVTMPEAWAMKTWLLAPVGFKLPLKTSVNITGVGFVGVIGALLLHAAVAPSAASAAVSA